MAIQSPLSQETNLVGRITQNRLTSTGLSLKVIFVDSKTGLARTPQSTTRLFTIDKDNENFEIILADSHSTTSGVTTITINASGRNLQLYGNLVGSGTGNDHAINAEVGCADVHIPTEVLNEIIRGNEGTNSNAFRVGDETDSDIYLYAQNADGNKPYIKYDSATNQWVSADDGASENPFNGSALTGGNGISVSGGAINVDTTDVANVFAKASGDAAENKVPVLNASNVIDSAFYDSSVLLTGVTTHVTYTPAYLTGGSNPTTNTAIWDSVSDGSFRATDIDGTAYNVDGIDLTSIASMADVASTIQAALRAQTGGTETVTWSGTEFVFTSTDTTSSSAFGVLTTSTGTVGTDISGAGGTNYLDSDSGNGTPTAAVLDPTADQGSVPLLNANGNVDTDVLREVIPTGGYTTKGDILAASAADTPAIVSAGSNGTVLVADSAQSEGVKWANITVSTGVITKDLSDASTTLDVTGIGFTPDYIEFEAFYCSGAGATVEWAKSSGVYDGSNNRCAGIYLDDSVGSSAFTDADDCISLTTNGTTGQVADVSAVASGQFTLNWTKSGSPTGTAYIVWKAFNLQP